MNLLRRRLQLVPKANPFTAFKTRFENDVKWLTLETLDMFHRYSFATLRQFGACFELSATYLKWLQKQNVKGMDFSIRAFTELSAGAKAIQFQLARALTRKKPLDLAAIDTMAKTWHNAVADLNSQCS